MLPYEPSLAGPDRARRRALDAHRLLFTVTEAGYYLDTKAGSTCPSADISGRHRACRPRARPSGEGVTIYGAVCAILRARKAADAGPLTLLNCDNLRHNGERFRAGLLEFIERAGDAELLAWTQANTRCPNAMVDRITPRPPPELRARVKAATGRDDAAAITGELHPVGHRGRLRGRPPRLGARGGRTGRLGAQPYEEAKIRIPQRHLQLHRLGPARWWASASFTRARTTPPSARWPSTT